MDSYLSQFACGYLEQIAYHDQVELNAYQSEPRWVAAVFRGSALFLLDAKPKLAGLDPFDAGTMFLMTRIKSPYGFAKLKVGQSRDFLIRRTMVLGPEQTKLSANGLREGSDAADVSTQVEEWLTAKQKDQASCQLAESLFER